MKRLGLVLASAFAMILVGCAPVAKPEPRLEDLILRAESPRLVTQTSARLVAFIDPKGTPLMVWFEYGEGYYSFGNRSAEFPVPPPATFVFDISGLNPGTRYSFRIAARYNQTIFHGEARSFVTDR